MQPFHFKHPDVEPMPGTRTRAFLVKTFEKSRFDFVWHLHPEFELTYIQKGAGVRYVGNSIRPFYERDLCLLGGNLPHAYGSHPGHGTPCAWQVIHFLPQTWGETFWQLPENNRIVRLFRAAGQGLHFHGEQLSTIEEKLISLEKIPLGNSKRLLLFLEVLQLLATSKNTDILNAGSREDETIERIDPRIGKVLDWLEEFASEDISQTQAAKLIGMPPASFSRFFRQKTGRLFSRHVNELRVARVCTSLATTQKSIAEIAFQSGFSNLANFNRRFVEVTGMKPKEYRALKG